MDYSTLADETLIKLVAHKQPDALSQLYDRYSSLVFGLALNLVGDHATAEEISLDVFTTVWGKAGTYRPERAKVNTWLSSIARYHSIDVLRRRGSRPEQHSISWDNVSARALPSDNDLDEVVELSMLRERVHAAVAQLPADQKQTLALAYFKGYTHRQIAEISGQPLGTVKTRIRLAIQKLRRILQEERTTVP
jgi:RNA polymerase sigma-70 factor, ECF subfamily